MNRYNCVVVDDEKTAREGIADYVQQIPFLTLAGKCKSALELDALLLTQKADIILLDINMPGLSGLEWLKRSHQSFLVILTTAHREYALDGFDLNVIDYLLKPISFARFSQAINKACQVASSRLASRDTSNTEDHHIFIKEDQQTIKIYLKDILYFEAAVDYIFIHCSDKRYMTLFSMKQVEQEVEGHHFLRIHRSYIINTHHVKLIEGRELVIGKVKLPISRDLFQSVYDHLVSNNLWKE